MSADAPRRRPVVLIVVTVLVAVLVVFWWRSDSGESVPSADERCSETVSAPEGDAGVTVVLVDRSASTRSEHGAPGYLTALRAAVSSAVERGDTVSVGAFDGSAATTDWVTVATTFSGEATARTIREGDARDCLELRLDSLASSTARTSGSDVVGALADALARTSAAAPGKAREVVVATDGLSNVGCADLNEFGFTGSPNQLRDRCATSDGLPHAAGVTIQFIGIGHPGGDHEILSTEQVNWLLDAWTELCIGATGDRALCPPSESVSLGPDGSASDQDGSGAGTSEDTAVFLPAVSEQTAAGRIEFTLPEALLFDTAMAVLKPSATAAIDDVTAKITAAGGTVVDVVGHTDARGNDGTNQLLSEARATAVADALTNRDLTVGAVHGAGEHSPKCEPQYRPDRSEDTAAMACNRRVEIVVSLPTGDAS